MQPAIARTFGDKASPSDFEVDFTMEETQQLYEDDNTENRNGAPKWDDLPDDYYNQFLNAEVLLPKEDSMMKGVVKQRKADDLGVPTGCRQENPILDTRTYHVQFHDGVEMVYTANCQHDCREYMGTI